MLRTMLLRKQLENLQAEESSLRTRQSGFATRESELATQVENANSEEELAAAAAAVEELETQQDTTKQRLEAIKHEIEALQAEIEEAETNAGAAGAGGGDPTDGTRSRTHGGNNRSLRSHLTPWLERAANNWQRRCEEFHRNGRLVYRSAQGMLSRAALLSSDTVGPVGVSGINEAVGSAPSAFIDMVTITDCTGEASHKIAYELDTIEAAAGTEGDDATESEATFGFVELTPHLYNVITYISKFVMKYTPLRYEEAIRRQIAKSLRAKVSKMAVDNLLASALVDAFPVTAASGNDVFTASLLDDLALSYGGDESVEGEAVLLMNKADLKGFLSVYGVNEFLPAYSYQPDGPSTGILQKRDGIAVRYVLNKNVPATYGATLTTGTPHKGMAYGDPKNLEIGLWGGFEVDVSKDYQFAKGLISLLGDVNADAAVNKQHGFTVLTITKST